MTLGRVLVVEDEQFTRTMIGTSVQALGFDVMGLCDSAECAMRTQRETPADVALLDLDLGPGPSGIDVAYALRKVSPEIGVVFLTSFRDPRVKDPRERALPRGSRYVVKSSLDDPELLRRALVAARHKPLAVAEQSARDLLTDNQLEVLRLVASGASNAEISATMQVSEKAIERTLQRVADALDLDSTSGNRRVLLARAYAELAGKAYP